MEEFKTRLCGKTISVVESDPMEWGNGAIGWSNVARSRILVDSNLTPDAKAETLLHEIIHIAARENSLSFKDNEQDVSTLSIALFSWMRDNPELVARMARGGE